MTAMVSIDDLKNESDVEQKFIYPLLTAAPPNGFGISPNSIETKTNIKRFIIGKGKEQKSYFPDYIIAKGGYPLVVIEAKERGADIEGAFREARLYANELNAQYKLGMDPVFLIVATNGDEFWVGSPGHVTPSVATTFDQLVPYSQAFADIQIFLSEVSLEARSQALRSKTRPSRLWKPRSLLGGQAIQDEVLAKNTFGSTISASLGQIFNPITRADRAKVVKEAYVPSNRRTRYVQPIDTIIRAASPLSHADAHLLSETDNPEPLVSSLQGGRELEHKVLLLIGGAGSGKTTFIDYLQEVALPLDIRNSTAWVHFNMNVAPVSRDEIYSWLRSNLIDELKSRNSDIDFDDLDQLKSLYSVEVNKFDKGRGKLYADKALYNEKLAERLKELEDDKHATAIAFCRYCGGERGKLVILVLDNCDKRQRDEQLLMFEAAQWLQREFRALVILPLREETYDNHRDEPPLDTALKDLVFRIEPPAFHDVLSKRVQLAREELKNDQKTYHYDLENSMHVEYQASDQGRYLGAIVSSLFDGDKRIGKLLLGLAGSNLRKAFELFLEICNSGHLPTSEILKIKRAQGTYHVPIHFILRALLRQSRRFYDSNHTYVKNLFAIEMDEGSEAHFLRLMILRWLEAKSGLTGPSRLKGYFPMRTLFEDICIYGFEEAEVRDKVEELARAHCVLSEDFKTDNLSDDALIRIGPAGVVHLDLLGDINYWAAISEDTFFDTKPPAQAIADRIANAQEHYSHVTAWFNANAAVEYMGVQRAAALAQSGFIETSRMAQLVDLSDARNTMSLSAKQLALGGWDTVEIDFPVGAEIDSAVARLHKGSVFVDFPTPGGRKNARLVSGLILRDSIPHDVKAELVPGRKLIVRVASVKGAQQRMDLEFVRLL
jgi:hypothetical protein